MIIEIKKIMLLLLKFYYPLVVDRLHCKLKNNMRVGKNPLLSTGLPVSARNAGTCILVTHTS